MRHLLELFNLRNSIVIYTVCSSYYLSSSSDFGPIHLNFLFNSCLLSFFSFKFAHDIGEHFTFPIACLWTVIHIEINMFKRFQQCLGTDREQSFDKNDICCLVNGKPVSSVLIRNSDHLFHFIEIISFLLQTL